MASESPKIGEQKRTPGTELVSHLKTPGAFASGVFVLELFTLMNSESHIHRYRKLAQSDSCTDVRVLFHLLRFFFYSKGKLMSYYHLFHTYILVSYFGKDNPECIFGEGYGVLLNAKYYNRS